MSIAGDCETVVCSRCGVPHAAETTQYEFVSGDTYCEGCRLVPVIRAGKFTFIRVGER